MPQRHPHDDPFRRWWEAEHELALRRMYETPDLDDLRRAMPPHPTVKRLLSQLPHPIERT